MLGAALVSCFAAGRDSFLERGVSRTGTGRRYCLYNAPANVRKYFNVFVRAPAVNPGYDPTKRRVFLRFKQEAPDNVSADHVLVGVGGIAVKKL